MNSNRYKYCLLLLGGLALAITLSPSANAIGNSESNSLDTFYLAQSPKANNKVNTREYTFKAPDAKVISNTEQLIKAQGYKVEVYGNEQQLLERVKDIEPSAFIKGDTIQVGIFSQQANAEDMVRKLAVRGFWARIEVQ